MKSVFYAAVFLIPLILLFTIFDRKESCSGEDVVIQGETITKITSASAKTPESAQEKLSVEALSFAECEAADVKLSETKHEISPSPTTGISIPSKTGTVSEAAFVTDKNTPAAIPVATQDKTEELNAEALSFAEKHAIRMKFLRNGMHLVSEDKFKETTTLSIAEHFDAVFQKNKVAKKREELSKKEIPNNWTIDLNTLIGNCDFEKTEDGYRISSPDGTLKIQSSAKSVLNTKIGLSIDLSCNTMETIVKVGVEDFGIYRPGKVFFEELSGIKENEIVNIEISSRDHFDLVRAFLEISGDVTIHSFRIFQKELKGTISLEGQIVERSVLPDPKQSDYPNCRFTAQFEGNVIKAGEPCPKEMAFIIDGFEDYKTLGTNTLKKGDKVLCTIIPYDALPEEEQSIQQADDLNLFSLENYYVLSMHKINDFSENASMPQSGVFFSNGSNEYVSVFERHLNEPVSQEIKNAQSVSIRNDLEKMNRLLNGYDEEKIKDLNRRFFEAWNKEIMKDPADYNRVGKYVWRNVDNSFWCLPVDYTFLSKPDILTQRTLDGFAALKEACESNGVQLIISLIPGLNEVSSRVLNKEFRDIPDLQTATYVKQLSEIGVETIYSTDTIIQNFNRFPFAFFFPGNGHPSDTTQDVNADILAERLKRYGIKQMLDPSLFSEKQTPHVYEKAKEYLFPNNCDIGDNEAGKPYTCREILYEGKTIPRTTDAPIITLGNSYLQTPMKAPESLPTLLSMKLLTAVDYYRVNAYGPFTSIITQILTNPERFFEHKKVLIIQIGTIHLTEANTKSLIVNIKEQDDNRVLLDRRSLVLSFENLDSEYNESIDNSLWENLPQKHVYTIGETKSKDIINISIESSIDISSKCICVIPAVCFAGHTAFLKVNGVEKNIPTFWRNPSYSFLAFELPPGTKTIEVSAEGNNGSTVAIKDIQIWQ